MKEYASRITRYRAVLSITCLGSCMRLFKLGSQSVWGDETLTLTKYATGNGFLDVWRHIWDVAVHPPLYFIIMHYWSMLGTSEFMLRFPSLVFGAASIPIAYALANRLYGRMPAVLTSLAVALSPIHIWYSQEARMYSLQLLLGLTATLFLIRAWQRKSAWDTLMYGISIALGVYTHVTAAALLLAHGLFIIMASAGNWKKLAGWVGVQILTALLFLPWIVNILHAKQALNGGLHIGSGHSHGFFDVGYGLYTFSVGYSLGPSNTELHMMGTARNILGYWPIIALSSLVFGILILLGMRQAYKHNKCGFKLLITILLVPIILSGLASMLPGIPLNPRYMLTAVIAFWVLLALGVQAAMQRRFSRFLPPIAVLLIMLSIYNHYFVPEYAKQDMRSAAAFLDHEVKNGDKIIISSIELGGPFYYYMTRPEVAVSGYPPGIGHVDPKKLPGDMEKLADSEERVWLILGRTWSSDPHGYILNYFQENSAMTNSRRFDGIDVYCFTPNQ